MTEPLDISALRAKLRVYDQSLPRCTKVITRVSNHAPDYVAEEERGEWEMRLTYPCGELEGHEGQCREGRAVLGWPGFATLTALLDEVEELRAEIAADEERRLQLLDDAGGLENEVRELRAENERLRENAEARERVMRREGDLLRAAQREVDELRAEVERTEHLRSSLDTALMLERERERAAVVAWLHAEAQHMYGAGQDRPAWFTLANRAEAIERGEHRREKEKP